MPYTKEQQIAQLMAYMKMVNESGKTCGLMEDLQHMGPDGTDWKDEFNKVVGQINTARGFILAPSEWLEGVEDLNYSDNICSLRKSLGIHNYDNGNIGCWCLE
jgi:hypothetical protein